MSLSQYQRKVQSFIRDISTLENKISDETKKESQKEKQKIQITQSIKSSTSPNTKFSKEKQINNLTNEIANIQKNTANFRKQLSTKKTELHNAESQLARIQEQNRKKKEQERKKKEQERLNNERKITQELNKQRSIQLSLNSSPLISETNSLIQYDFFISHASEDKEEFVRPLVEELSKLDLKIWYDEFTLKIGDSLRRSIDQGLANSRYGIVVLSSAFFAKNWPEYEFNGMIAKEMNGVKVVLPIWHKVSKDEVLRYSPSLADKLALNSSLKSVVEIAKELADLLN